MYATPVHRLVNRGFVVFFLFGALFNIAKAGLTALITGTVLFIIAGLLLALSFLSEPLSKGLQFALLSAVALLLVFLNHVHDRVGLMLIGILCLMAIEYGYLRRRVLRKTALALVLLGLSICASLFRGFKTPSPSGPEGWNLASTLLLVLVWGYLLFVLVAVPRLRVEQRTFMLERDASLQSAYYNEGGLSGEEKGTFFDLREGGTRKAMLAPRGAGVTIYSDPDAFIPLSRRELLYLVRAMGISSAELRGPPRSFHPRDDSSRQ